ncbi:MAG: DUF1572 family protein [Cyclobacteriaceae bacterium]
MEIKNIIRLFSYYKGLGEKTIAVLSDEELHLEPGTDVNSVSIIVKHLWGNMRSRWTNFLTEDGEKDWRERDAEFESTIKTRAELMEKWSEGWKCLFDALETLEEKDLNRIVYIRNEGHSVIDAIHRQLAHYSYHIGQIVFLGKMIKEEEWVSLSIPKNESDSYNKEKFDSEKGERHFTDRV